MANLPLATVNFEPCSYPNFTQKGMHNSQIVCLTFSLTYMADWINCCFTTLSTVLQSYLATGRVIMKCCLLKKSCSWLKRIMSPVASIEHFGDRLLGFEPEMLAQ